MKKLLCWMRKHDWRGSGTKVRTAEDGGTLAAPTPITVTCARCGKIADLKQITATTEGCYISRGRSRVEKLGDGITLTAILMLLALALAVLWEFKR